MARGIRFYSMSGQLVASVVIPTYNRKPRLARVLKALETQDLDLSSFEVVVVDDGSSDGTFEFLQQARPLRVNAIRQPNGGPARARNTGVAAAKGKYIVFVDDDVEPIASLVSEHLRSHQLSPASVVIGPLSSLPRYPQPWVQWEQQKLERQYSAMERGDWAPTFRQFWTGNASLEREHLVAEGGFNVEILRGEDVELGFRLKQRGLGFVFNPLARGFHHAERSLQSWMFAHESYGRLEVEIFGRDGEQHLLATLRANWRHLHPALRGAVHQCIAHPRLYSLARAAIQRALLVEAAAGTQVLASELCSALANILYWRASAVELGELRAAQVFSP